MNYYLHQHEVMFLHILVYLSASVGTVVCLSVTTNITQAVNRLL